MPHRRALRVALVACALACALACAGRLPAQPPPYTVTAGRIVSAMQPAIRVDVDTALHYVASQRWILYGVAQAEQHLFVQRASRGVERFVWVQLEEYLPTSNGRYDYSSDAPITAFGRELRVSTEVWTMPTTETRPQSDGAYARRLLREHGITLPSPMLYARLIYLPDTTRRRELMVIYAERAPSIDTSSTAKPALDTSLAEHARRALHAFTITTVP
jgi:hypothetical protein